MSEPTKFLFSSGEAEVIEKKSRFIANSFVVESIEEVERFLEEARKKYWDARHNCYAYYINNNLQKFSDDGEPSRTAGLPILEVIRGRGVHNCLVIVTRYFGGTLLGSGGLIRAYTKASNKCLDASKLIDVFRGACVLIRASYDLYGKIDYLLRESNIFVEGVDFLEEVTLTCYIKVDELDKIQLALSELSSGEIVMKVEKTSRFAVVDSKVVEV